MTRPQIVPCTLKDARRFVMKHHRHSKAPQGGLFALGLAVDRELRAVVIVGRPLARALADGSTAEVTRLCSLGDRNSCSMLYAAAKRAAQALGYRRLVTYTRTHESGASLRGAGWSHVADVRGGRNWSWHGVAPQDPHAEQVDAFPEAPDHADKRRWEIAIS